MDIYCLLLSALKGLLLRLQPRLQGGKKKSRGEAAALITGLAGVQQASSSDGEQEKEEDPLQKKEKAESQREGESTTCMM